MTDETRPTPQGGAAAGGQDPVDALASWFRATPKEDESAAGDGDSNGNDGADDGEHAEAERTEASSPSESSTAPSPITPGSTAGGHRPVDDDDEPRQARAPRTRPETTPPAAPVPTPPDDEADAESPAEPASTAPATSVPAKSAPADAAPAEAESPNATVGPARSGVWSAQPDSADGGDPPDADNVATPAPKDGEKSSDEPAPSADQTAVADLLASFNAGTPSSTAARESATDEATDEETPAVAEDNARTQLIPRTAAGPESPREAGDRTQLLPLVPPAPPAAPTEMLPRIEAATPGAAVRGLEPQTSKTYGGKVDDDAVEGDWNPEPDPEPYSPAEQTQHSYQQQFQQAYRAPSGPPRAPAQPLGSAALPAGMSVRGYDDYDDFDRYDDPSRGPERRPSRARRALFATTGVIVLVLVVGAGLVFSGKVSVLGLSAKAPVPTVGFSPSGADAGTDATQTGTAFLTAWENGGLKAASNITDDPATALDQLTQYKSALKVSGLTIQPGSATTAGWMTFNVSAQVGSPASAWNYSSGLATYSKQVNGYTRWFVKWQPNLMFTSLKAGQHLTLGTIPAVANKVVDRNGAEITSSNAPSLRGIVSALKKSAPPSDGTPGQEVQITDAKGAKVSKVAKISDPVSTGAVKTTIDLHAQAAAQTAVQRAPNSSMVVIQPSTGDILAVANNPANGLDTAMVGKYAPGSTFKTVTTALVLNKGVIKNLGQTWDCPKVLNADGITLHNSEQEGGAGQSFLWDFAQSCNNAFSRFGGSVSRSELVTTAHDYFGFNQPWDVGLGLPTVYGNVPNTSANSLAEELVGQDRITASPLMMASVAATVAAGSFKQPILVPGTAQATATALPSGTDKNLKTLMRAVVTNGTLATAFSGLSGAYGKTGTAEVQGKTANSWTIAFKGDYAVGALAIGGNYGASTAAPEVKALLKAVS